MALPNIARSHGSRVPPSWDRERPYLTGHALRESAYAPGCAEMSDTEKIPPLAANPRSVQAFIAADDILSALLGIPGNFARAERLPPDRTGYLAAMRAPIHFVFCPGQTAGELDVAVPVLAQRALALADDFVAVAEFVEKTRDAGDAQGYVRQALGVAIEGLLGDYRQLVLRLEHALRKGELSLQRLLFYLQPSMRSMSLLRRMIECVGSNVGGAAFDSVFEVAATYVGSVDMRTVLAFIVGKAAAPLLDCMRTWMCEGIIDDRYKEFFVEENSKYTRGIMVDNFTLSKTWDLRYTVNKDNLPNLLAPFVENILCAGKYLNVLRESHAKPPATRNAESVTSFEELRLKISGEVLLGPDASRRIATFVDVAYNHASTRLLDHLKDEVRVLDRVRSIKRYFLLEQGDFLVHFFDAAHEELSKSVKDVSLTKLSSLLELSIRTSVSAADPFHDDLGCRLFSSDLATQILHVLGSDEPLYVFPSESEPEQQQSSEHGATAESDALVSAQEHLSKLNGYDTFSLTYVVTWPMNLIVSASELLKYQLVFRYLLHCKHVERELESCWRGLAQLKGRNRPLIRHFAHSFALCHRMLQFIRDILYFVVADVLEPNWQEFEASYTTADTIDEIMSCHSEFIDSCVSQCLLSNDRHIRVFHAVTKVSLLFAEYNEQFTQKLSCGMSIAEIASIVHQRGYRGTISKFESAFDLNLRQLLDGLSVMSKKRANTHLANLCARLDFVGFYERAAVKSSANLENY